MRKHPIRLGLRTTRSSKPREQQKVREFNRTAAVLEAHINRKIDEAPDNSFHQFMHANLAIDLDLDREVVCHALMSAEGGSNGITVLKGDFDKAMERNSKRD
jgi:hypothetical protein